ncbi:MULTISPECIES: MFS transporter [unclassified Mesorhizobium]|uniref:MFS transporter n=1 Tax=unclassified Mesorhizobium TaxID=325217 RepID=UPI00112CCB8D|nr:MULTISPECIES: MFS transporter [unclassified Mesorhizobium]TPJ47624.1 MFS transporter [Mesorhizobium sp. B2-6-6]MBZ9916755.1 MFS transporter [Mesorhizobium sp. BR1-1-7]MBZ9955940.1 MFS transporter [Mesorhizobium sp. BR1-1-15]MBZ9969374.1 MFS transporter [Mesorhizobium sp. BR1-1-12]MCA0001411.1 MFS transporter [Mesorhizobium sp. B264B2A]
MSTHVRHPIWLPALKAADARTFASLYAVESFARATVSSVIPIQAYEILHNEQIVSILYTIVAMLGLSVTLFMPMLIQRFARRWVYTAGACLLAIGSLFFVTHTLAGQLAGMLCRVMGASALSITLNLYIMDHIRKTDFMQAESLRMAWSMFAWTGGPTLGIFLYTRFGIYAAHGAVAVFALALLALFWTYRLGDNASIRPGKTRPVNPLANIGRFVAQPRLRLAWLIAFGRSCFWTTFFVYGPLFMVITGEGELAGGILVSAGNALLFMAIFWGKAGKRFGGRRTMTFAYFAMSVVLLAAGAVGESAPLVTGAFLLCGAFFTIALDALGSTAFMRSVRSYERAQMAAVYRTYLDFSELTPPLVYSVVLAFFGLGSVFVTLGLLAAVCGYVTWRYLPKSL